MLDSHILIRLISNIAGTLLGYFTYRKVRHVGILAIVASTVLSIILGVGIMMDIIYRTDELYLYCFDIVRILSALGLYYIWKAVDEFIE